MKLMPSSPPHIRSQDSNATVMFYVICALGSLYFMGTFFYGMRALVLGVLSVVTCLATDLLCTRCRAENLPVGLFQHSHRHVDPLVYACLHQLLDCGCGRGVRHCSGQASLRRFGAEYL